MGLVWTFVFFFIGLMVASFTLIQILIILFFGIPLTRKLEHKGLIKKDNGITQGNMASIVILSMFYAGAHYVVTHFLPVGQIGFLMGTGMSLLMGLGQIGMNKNNLSDYLSTNKRHLTVSEAEALSELMKG